MQNIGNAIGGGGSANLALLQRIEKLEEENKDVKEKIADLYSIVRQLKIWSAGEWTANGGSFPSEAGSYGTVARLFGSSTPDKYREATYYILVTSNKKLFVGTQMNTSGIIWTEK